MKKYWWVLSVLGALGMIAIAPQTAFGAARIIEANGRVLVRRSQSSPYEPAAVGTVLQQGHWIRPDRGVRVLVRCSDGINWPVPAGVPSGIGVGCPNSRVQLRTRGRGDDVFLAFLNNSFIYATQVQTLDPLLQWNPFPDASRYTLRIDACDEEGFCDQGQVWQNLIEGSPPQVDDEMLQRERTYQLTLTNSDEQGRSQTASLRFRLISEAESAQIQAEIADTESQTLTEEARAIAYSDIYASVAHPNTRTPEDIGLVFEAIAILEEAVSQGSQTPYIYRLLGDSYLQVGLLEQARTHCEQALDLAQYSEHALDRVSAQVGLANIAAAQDRLIEAEGWLRQAKIGYSLLGETRHVENIEKWLAALSR